MKAHEKQGKKQKKKSEEQLMRAFQDNKGGNLKMLIRIFKGHYWELIGSIFFFIIKHSPVWVLPIVTANIINEATYRHETAVRAIMINVIVMLIFLVQNIFTNYLHTWLYAKTVREVERDLRFALVKKLQLLSIPYHNGIQSGRLQSKVIRDVEQIQNLSAQIFITILSILLNIGVSLGVILYKSRTVFLFFGFTIPAAVFLVVAFKGKIKIYNREFREIMEETSAKVMEMVELIPITRAHALEEEETEKMGYHLSQVAEKGLKLDMVQTWFSSISWVMFQAFQVFCLGFTGWMAFRGSIEIGDITLYQTYFSSIVAQVSGVITLLPIISKGLESVNSIGEILTETDVEENEGKEKFQSVEGNIQFEHVKFSYEEKDRPILNDLNLTIKKGETIAFVGDSGAGKTTILNLLIGFLKVKGGRILIDGHDLEKIDMRSFREHIAVVTQQSILFTGTLRENITYGLEHITEEQVENAIKGANLEELVKSLPEGLDTKINEHGSNLSGGQKQRISIARAFIRNPDILILDEATSALDSVSEKKIQDSIEKLVEGRTTLVVAHRFSTIRNADKIAVIGNGGILEYGNYEELMEQHGKFYEMRMLQA